MLPNIGDAKVDKILSQFSQRYSNEEYIAEKILPPLKVAEKSGKYSKYGTENFRTYGDATLRAPGTRANTIDYSVSTGAYLCSEKSLEKRVPDEMKNNTDDPYDAKRDATAVIMDNIWVNQEAALAAAMEGTSVITQNTTLSGTDQWNDYDDSNPLDDISDGISVIRSATAKRPNVAVMGFDVMTKLRQHPDVREQVKYTNGGQISEDAFISFLKAFFRLDEVLIGTAIKNTADEGQTAVLSDCWGDHFWLIHRNKRPTLMQATFGYTFFDVPRVVDQYREESHKSDVVRQRYSYDQNLMDVAQCYLIKNAIA